MKQLSHAEMQAFALQDPRAFVELVEANNVGKVKARLAANRSNSGAPAPTERPRQQTQGESAVRPLNTATAKRNRPGGRVMHTTPSGPAPMPALFLAVLALGGAVWVLAVVGAVAITRRILGQG